MYSSEIGKKRIDCVVASTEVSCFGLTKYQYMRMRMNRARREKNSGKNV